MEDLCLSLNALMHGAIACFPLFCLPGICKNVILVAVLVVFIRHTIAVLNQT